MEKANLHVALLFQSGYNLFVVLIVELLGIQRLDVVCTFGSKETQTVHVANGGKCRIVELHAKMFKQAVEEEEDIEADARLRTVGIQHPYRSAVFKHLLAMSISELSMKTLSRHFL